MSTNDNEKTFASFGLHFGIEFTLPVSGEKTFFAVVVWGQQSCKPELFIGMNRTENTCIFQISCKIGFG